jgi:hypothetical protein
MCMVFCTFHLFSTAGGLRGKREIGDGRRWSEGWLRKNEGLGIEEGGKKGGTIDYFLRIAYGGGGGGGPQKN